MKVTVCIPSHDRGSTALRSVLWMRNYLPKDISIVVVDNASAKDTEGYAALALRPDVTLVHEAEHGFLQSFNACLKSVQEGVLLFCADEDVIPLPAIERLYDIDWDKVAIVKGGVGALEGVTSGDVYPSQDAYFTKGKEALLTFGFANSYLSGTAYNLSKFTAATGTYFANCWKHTVYPHIYLDLLGCVMGDVQMVAIDMALNAETAENATIPSQYGTEYSLGSRIDQHIAMRDGLFDAMKLMGWDLDTFAQAYARLCMRTLRMVTAVNMPQYRQARIDPGGCVAVAVNACIAAYMDFKHCAPTFEWMQHRIQAMVGGEQGPAA